MSETQPAPAPLSPQEHHASQRAWLSAGRPPSEYTPAAGHALAQEAARVASEAGHAPPAPTTPANPATPAAGQPAQPTGPAWLAPAPGVEPEAQAAHDTAFGFNPANPLSPEEYHVDFMNAGVGRSMDMASLVMAKTEWGAFLASTQIEPSVGSYLVERALANSHKLAAMPEADRALWKLNELQTGLRSAGSPEAVKETVRLAGVTLATAIRSGHSNTVEHLLSSGALSDWFTVRSLANHGARIEGWQKGK